MLWVLEKLVNAMEMLKRDVPTEARMAEAARELVALYPRDMPPELAERVADLRRAMGHPPFILTGEEVARFEAGVASLIEEIERRLGTR